MTKAQWIAGKLQELDDEAFVEALSEAAERPLHHEPIPHDGLVHIHELEAEIRHEYETWGKPKGLMTGVTSLDKKIGGMSPGHMILVGGETSSGKSALAANIAVNVARHSPVLFITLEMLQQEIGARMMHINHGTLDGLDLTFQQTYSIDYKDLEPIIKRAVEDAGVKLVILDYLQYLGRGMKNEEVALISKRIKQIALEYHLPIIAVVSLRKGDAKFKRKWTDIEIDDLMGTGSIGYDADTALIASRKDLENDFQMDHMYVKVLKTRNSQLDFNDRYVILHWDKTRISDDFTVFPTGFRQSA